MTTFGLTPQGFVVKPELQIQADMQADWRNTFGQDVPVNPQSVNGQIINIVSNRIAELWDLLEGVYASFDPDQASGTELDAVCAITGTIRGGATNSTVLETLAGTTGTVIPAGSIINTNGSAAVSFVTQEDATLVVVTAWIGSHSYSAGQRAANGGNIYQALNNGMSASSGGPSGTGSLITDNTVQWTYIGTGTGVVDVECLSENTGPVEAPARTLTQITTPVSGWSTAINLLDAALGVTQQSDNALRVTRQQELHSSGLSPVDAIRADLLANVPNIIDATVFENPTDAVNGDGMPPHSVECVVTGGANQDIWNQVWHSVAAGINDTFGNTVGTTTDSQGNVQTVSFTRPTIEDVWIIVNALVDPTVFPLNGESEILANVLAYGATLVAGYDIFSSQIGAAIMRGVPAANLVGIPGVLDVGLPLIGLSNPPVVSTTIAISSRQIGSFDATRIVINITDGTP